MGEVRRNMPTQTLDPSLQELLRGRYIATLGTENADGSIHLTAVWYLFESGGLYVASSKTQRLAMSRRDPFADGGRAKLGLSVASPLRKVEVISGVSGDKWAHT
jgi:hypothetical protein